MKIIPPKEFLLATKAYGLAPKPSLDDCRYLEMLGEHDSRFWCVPQPAARIPYFLRTLLTGMDKWNEVIVWPRLQKWSLFPANSFPGVVPTNDFVIESILKNVGVLEQPPGALIFSKEELEPLIALLFAHVVFGNNSEHDLCVIPDHGEQLLQTDHHDVVHMDCRTDVRLEQFIDYMAREAYPLPAELPDWTFIRPHWMK